LRIALGGPLREVAKGRESSSPSFCPDHLSIQCLSLNDRSAPSALRERFALSGDGLKSALQSAKATKGIERIVILATCQRVELYTAHPDSSETRERLTAWLAAQGGVEPSVVAEHAEYHEGISAAHHLFRVATGLDAALLGEAQILSQVAVASRVAVAEHAAIPPLKALFRAAVQTGERARGSVWSQYPRADVGSVSLGVAAERIGGVRDKRAVVIGGGKVGQLGLRALRAMGIGSIALVNRTLTHVTALGEEFSATTHGLDALPSVLSDADILFVATSAPTPIVDAAMIRAARAGRGDVPLVVIDTAMPHNVEPAVRGMDGVHVLDLDDLEPTLASARRERADAIPVVETIINEELETLTQHYAATPIAKSWGRPAVSSGVTS